MSPSLSIPMYEYMRCSVQEIHVYKCNALPNKRVKLTTVLPRNWLQLAEMNNSRFCPCYAPDALLAPVCLGTLTRKTGEAHHPTPQAFSMLLRLLSEIL
jgi:hypothetical protein